MGVQHRYRGRVIISDQARERCDSHKYGQQCTVVGVTISERGKKTRTEDRSRSSLLTVTL